MRFRTSHRTADERRRSFPCRPLAVAAITLAVTFALVTARLFVWPAQGMPTHVSAIVMLAGPGDRLPVALRLAREHRAPVLVVSQGQHGYGGPCPPMMPGVKLICFDPNPGNTRGEAEFVGQLADRYHWTSVVLVTTQGTRHPGPNPSETLFRRLDLCDHGIIAAGQLALPDRLRVGSAAQGAGPVPFMLACLNGVVAAAMRRLSRCSGRRARRQNQARSARHGVPSVSKHRHSVRLRCGRAKARHKAT